MPTTTAPVRSTVVRSRATECKVERQGVAGARPWPMQKGQPALPLLHWRYGCGYTIYVGRPAANRASNYPEPGRRQARSTAARERIRLWRSARLLHTRFIRGSACAAYACPITQHAAPTSKRKLSLTVVMFMPSPILLTCLAGTKSDQRHYAVGLLANRANRLRFITGRRHGPPGLCWRRFSAGHRPSRVLRWHHRPRVNPVLCPLPAKPVGI